MDYFKEAFGGFNPLGDEDAALKFCLDVILADNRIDELQRLISEDGQLGGVEGEPGWIVECRQNGEIDGYETWPKDARFRAHVDPDSYTLTYPEFFSNRKTFLYYVGAIVSVYKRRNPELANRVRRIEEVLASEV